MTEPRTDAGRELLHLLTNDGKPGRLRGRPINEWIDAIEAEAATPPTPDAGLTAAIAEVVELWERYNEDPRSLTPLGRSIERLARLPAPTTAGLDVEAVKVLAEYPIPSEQGRSHDGQMYTRGWNAAVKTAREEAARLSVLPTSVGDTDG